MRLFRFLMGLAFLVLSGCATTQNYEKMLSSWVGQPVSAVVAQWGPPDSEFVNEGTRYLTWYKSGQIYMPPSSPTYTTSFVGNTAYTTTVGGMPGYNLWFSCKTTFIVQDGHVTKWRWEGNDCLARDPQ